MCNCKNVDLGTFANQVEIHHPKLSHPVWVDVCIADEIINLLSNGVKTMASCCGHNKTIPSIMVAPESVKLMEAMGYKHHFNFCVNTGKFARCYFYSKSVKCPWWRKFYNEVIRRAWWHLINPPQ